MALILYPSFGQVIESINSGFILPTEADIKSIKFINNIAYQIIPTEYLSTVYKNGQSYKGIIVDINDKVVTIENVESDKDIDDIKNRLTIRNYDSTITLPNSYELNYEGKKVEIVSFLIKAASAQSFYTFDLKQRLLQQLASLVVPFDFVGDISIVAGDIKMQQSVQTESYGLAMAAAPTMRSRTINSSSEVEDVSEYKHIVIGKRDLHKGNNIVTINSFNNINYKIIYHHDLNSTDIVYFSYNFIAPAFLANGIVSVYDEQVLIGKSSIDENQKAGQIKIIMGQTSRITVDTKVNKQQDDKLSTDYNIDFVSKLDNKTDTMVDLELEYYIGSAKVSNVENISKIYIENDKIIIPIKLKPGKQTVSGSFDLKY